MFEAYFAKQNFGILLAQGTPCTPDSASLSMLCAAAEDGYSHFYGWVELMLYSARQRDRDPTGKTWHEMIDKMIVEAAIVGQISDASRLLGLADLLVGLLFVISSQHLRESQIRDVFVGGCDPLVTWKPAAPSRAPKQLIAR